MLARPHGLRIVLAHELQHMRTHDTEWEIGLELLRPLFFWNPAYILWKRSFEHLRELSCDETLLRHRRIDPRAYAQCLLSVCDRSVARRQARNLALPRVPLVAFGEGRRAARILRQRIAAICGRNLASTRQKAPVWVPLALATLAVILVASSLRNSADWSQDRLMLSTVVNLERMETRNAGLSLAGY